MTPTYPVAVRMPPLSQTMDTLLLVEWLKPPGAPVQQGEPLFVVESDKATLEVEAPASGVLQGPLAAVGVEAQVGALLAQIVAAPDLTPQPPRAAGEQEQQASRAGRIFASPRARTLAQEAGVGLAALTPSGPDGLIVARDVQAALPPPPAAAPAAVPAPGADAAPPAAEGAAHTPLAPLRRTLAARLQASQAVPVTLTRTVDATELVALRRRLLADLPPGREPPTFTDLFVWMTARALLRHPALNGTLAGDALALEPAVHLALAVETARGLIAPVLRDAQRAGLLELAQQRAALVQRARAGQTPAAELAGGTFTLTNLGPQQIDAFTPVINPPQIAILGVGRIHPAAAVYAGALAVRDLVTLSLTFDHRATDGAPAAAFLGAVACYIEAPHRIWYEE